MYPRGLTSLGILNWWLVEIVEPAPLWRRLIAMVKHKVYSVGAMR